LKNAEIALVYIAIAVVAAAVAHFRRIEVQSARGSAAEDGRVGSAWKWHGRRGWRS